MFQKIVLPLALLALGGITVAFAATSAPAPRPGAGNPCAVQQKNPCAAQPKNPCAPQAQNPCAPKPVNPCAPKSQNPCAPK